MLVLTRKAGETLFIGDDIKITINELCGDKVKIGIEAPKDMKVLREELYQTISANKQAVSAVPVASLRSFLQNVKQPQENK